VETVTPPCRSAAGTPGSTAQPVAQATWSTSPDPIDVGRGDAT